MEQSGDHQRTKAMPISEEYRWRYTRNAEAGLSITEQPAGGNRDSVLYESVGAIPRNSLYVKGVKAIYNIMLKLLYTVSPEHFQHTAVLKTEDGASSPSVTSLSDCCDHRCVLLCAAVSGCIIAIIN
jgi:hypothetical protein